MNPQVTPKATTAGFWFVRSEHPERRHLFYRVSVDPRTGLFTCECPDHVHRRRDCKHAKTVQAGGGIAAEPKRMPAPVPARIATTPATRRRSVQMAV